MEMGGKTFKFFSSFKTKTKFQSEMSFQNFPIKNRRKKIKSGIFLQKHIVFNETSFFNRKSFSQKISSCIL